MGELMEWARILAYISGTMDRELLLRNEYLAAENQILRGQLKGRPKLLDAERAKLGEIGRRLGRKALGDVATAALPDTILGWYRRLVARKFDGSKHRSPGRPLVDRAIEELIVLMAEENRSWGYDRIVGALANLGFEVSDQTVGNVLRRHGVSPAPERKRTTTWPRPSFGPTRRLLRHYHQLTRFGKLATSYQLQVLPPFQFFDHTGKTRKWRGAQQRLQLRLQRGVAA